MATIRQAAIQILMTEGYAQATTVRIARVAGVSVGTLYQYFDDRDAVFDGVIDEVLTALIEAVGVALIAPTSSTLPDHLYQAVLAGLTTLEKHPMVLRRLDGIPGSSFRGKLVEAKLLTRKITEAFLASRQPDLRLPDLPLVARMLVDVAEGIAYNLQVDDDIEVLAGETAALVHAYLIDASRRRTGPELA